MAPKTLNIVYAADSSAVTKSFREIEGGANRFGSTMTKVIGGLGIVAAGKQILDFGKSSVSAFSDSQEALSKVNTVFGDWAIDIEQFADSAASSIGLTRTAALDAAGGFGNLFTQLGFNRGAATDMSTSIIKLASDFGSFHNADITDVLDAQSAAFRGEYDSLQRFLPLINAATVEQKAMAMSGKENADELTAQEKAMAVYQLMLEGAGPAMGDFARTSDGLANKQRILKAEIDNLRTAVGGELINTVFPKFIDGLLGGDNATGDLATSVANFTKNLPAYGRAVGNFAEDLGSLIRQVRDLVGWVIDAVRWLDKFIGKESVANRILATALGTKGSYLPADNPPRKPMTKNYHGIPGRAAGGPVSRGTAYIVGENGPEILVPGASGQIIPNAKTAGAAPGGVVNNFYLVVAPSGPVVGAQARQELGEIVMDQFQDFLRANAHMAWQN